MVPSSTVSPLIPWIGLRPAPKGGGAFYLRAMSDTATITVEISIAWWLRPYLAGVSLMCWLTGLEPDEARVCYWVRKGLKVEVVGGKSRKVAWRWKQ